MKKSATIKQIYDELQESVDWTIQVLRRKYVDAYEQRHGSREVSEWIQLPNEVSYGDGAVLKLSIHSRNKSCMLHADGLRLVVDWYDLSTKDSIAVVDGLETLLNDLTHE